MNLVTGHVTVIGIVAVCTTVLGMAHLASPTDATDIFLACVASFSTHGVAATLRPSKQSGESETT